MLAGGDNMLGRGEKSIPEQTKYVYQVKFI